MKKILSLFITIVLCFNIASVGAYIKFDSDDKSKAVKELILTKNKLNNTTNGKKYVNIIDKFININKNNEDKLLKIYNKINPLLSENKIKNIETLYIIKYMNSKITIALINLYNNEIEIDPISTNNQINESDKKLIEEKIINLQLNALEKGTNIIENITKEFENLTNYEESGNFQMDVNLDHKDLGKFKGNFKLNNYTSKTSSFDTQFKGEIEALINAIPNGEEEIKLQLNSVIDFISKDGNMYLLLEKFNILEESGVEDLKEFLDKAKEIAKQNKYIEYSDPNTQMGMNMLKSLNPSNIISDSKTILSKPMVTTYKKEGDKYYLLPTKYACDSFKEIANKFDPFSPAKCTDSQYKDLVKEITASGDFYAEILNNSKTKIGFIGKKEFGLQKNQGYIVFDDEKILEINYEIDAGTEGNLNLNYIYGSKLDFNFKSNGEGEATFISTLNNQNKFEKIDANIDIDNSIATLQLSNNIITGAWSIVNKYSNEKFIGTIKGKTDINDKLNELNIDYKLDSKTDELNGNLSFGNSKIYFENYYEGKKDKSTILIETDLDNNYLPNNGKINISVFTKSGHYDYETWEYITDDDFSEVLKIDLDIENKNILGSTKISEGENQIIEILHSGKYSNKIFQLDNKFVFGDVYSNYIASNDLQVEGNFNINIDTSNNKNNANIFMNLFFGSDEIFNFEIKNTGKVEYKNVEILTPTNTIDYKNVFDIENSYY